MVEQGASRIKESVLQGHRGALLSQKARGKMSLLIISVVGEIGRLSVRRGRQEFVKVTMWVGTGESAVVTGNIGVI